MSRRIGVPLLVAANGRQRNQQLVESGKATPRTGVSPRSSPMMTRAIPALKHVLFYVGFLGGGGLMAKALWSIPTVADCVTQLRESVATCLAAAVGVTAGSFLVDVAAMALGVSLVVFAGHTIKKRRKQSDFQREVAKRGSSGEKPRLVPFWRRASSSLWCGVVAVTTAVGAAACFLGSHPFASAMWSYFASHTERLLSAVSPVLTEAAATGSVQLGLGLASVLCASWIYARSASKKHPPIFARYYVDGFMAPTRFLHPKTLNIRRSMLVLRSQSEETRGMHSETVLCSRVKATDYETKRSKTLWMAYRSDLEPHEMRRDLTADDVTRVLAYLRDHLSKPGAISADRIAEIADEADVYQAADKGELNGADKELTAFDVGRIVKAIAVVPTDDVTTLDRELLVKRLNRETLYNIGGYFQANVYDGRPFSLRVSVRENIVQSDAISQDTRGGYGRDYAERGKMLMVLQFRCYESNRNESGDAWLEAGDTASNSGGASTNVIREDRKSWNQLLKHGLGKSYLIYWGDRTYIYDENWMRSGKFITDLLPGLHGEEYAIRRIGYVYDNQGAIVAKVADDAWTVPAKPFGNYNRIVDLYDLTLAKDENFGALLCAFSRFLTHQHMYRHNRLQEALPAGMPFGGADVDVAGQV